jgi:hypothetical protein
MLIHRQNSYAPRSKQRSCRREAQSREPVNKVKKKNKYLYKDLRRCDHDVIEVPSQNLPGGFKENHEKPQS